MQPCKCELEMVLRSLHILAGPPGAGKTTVLRALSKRVDVVAEPARRVLAQQRATGGVGTGDGDRALFVRLMLEMAQRDHLKAPAQAVFDRGLPDLLAFCAHYALPALAVRRAIKAHPYARDVFWFPPWQAIYAQDDERKLDFEGAVGFSDLIQNAYAQSGYTLINVPKTTPQARADFILKRINA